LTIVVVIGVPETGFCLIKIKIYASTCISVNVSITVTYTITSWFAPPTVPLHWSAFLLAMMPFDSAKKWTS